MDTLRTHSTRAWSRSALPLLMLWAGVLSQACGGGDTGPQGGATAPGTSRTQATRVLETGGNLLQDKTPVEQISVYLNGFHPAKDDPSMQMESHHYCDQVNEDFMQCVLYDGNTAEARLHGIEYIISEALFEKLPQGERQYWHPHNYEILSGTLRMPGLPAAAEKATLARKINSYGKTWHVWMSGVRGREPDALPLGAPHLAWSFNRDGEAMPGLVEDRDSRMGLDSTSARRERHDLVEHAHPQEGVDALRTHFPEAAPVTGVSAKP